jgi:cell division protein FtsZ
MTHGGEHRSNGHAHGFAEDVERVARIKVVGVGGGGCNAVARMAQADIRGVELVALNTDAQHLKKIQAHYRIHLGDKVSRGLGAGGNPTIGAKAAEESADELYELFRDTDMIFIAAGMGGGTGTGAAPRVAQIAQEVGALTVGVVTRPFRYEGEKRRAVAEEGINQLKEHVDALIVIPNDRLLQVVDKKVGLVACILTIMLVM